MSKQDEVISNAPTKKEKNGVVEHSVEEMEVGILIPSFERQIWVSILSSHLIIESI